MGIYLGRTLSDVDTLRVSLEASESDSTLGVVVFELFLSGVSAARTQVTCLEMELPEDLKQVAKRFIYQHPSFKLPESVKTALLNGLADRTNHSEPLWLDIDPPGSLLSIVPWESMLQEPLKTRLIRLSFFPASSYFPHWNNLDIVICASAAKAKVKFNMPQERIDVQVPQLALRILETQKMPTTIHIFADQEIYGTLKQKLAPKVVGQGGHGVMLYDPALAAHYEAPRRTREVVDELDKVTNPWLRWMMDSLAGQTIDLVHFVCHGFLYTDQGALALAESPTVNNDSSWARFVGPRQLNTFLDNVGAYTAGFCSPLHNYSIAGLQFLVEQIARLRPGVSMFHNSLEDPNFDHLCSTYSALYSADRNGLIDWKSSTTLFCAPKLFKSAASEPPDPPDPDEDGRGTWDPHVIDAEFVPAVSKQDGAWVAAGHRWLERTASQLNDASFSVAQASTKEAVQETLTFVSNVINQYSLKM
jgi:hypothetical protein